MAIVEMQKIHILALARHKDEILKYLQRNEAVDIQQVSEAERTPPPAEELGRIELELAEIKSAIAFLEEITEKKKSFIETFIPSKEEISEQELTQVCREFNCAEIVKICAGLENRLANQRNLRNELQSEYDRLQPWKNLDTPLNTLTCAVKTCFLPGKIKPGQFQDFKDQLQKISEAVEIMVIDRTREDVFVILIHLAREKERFAELLAKSSFEQLTLPLSEHTPAQEMSRLRQLMKETESEIREIVSETRELVRHLSRLKFMHDFVLERRSTLSVKQKFAETEYTFVIEGWVKKTDFEKIKRELERITAEMEVFKLDPAPGEKPPVALKNPPPLSPFELITKIYGTPRHDEFDPSLALSFFFALFFGLCLGDFGYGVILALISIYFLKKYRLPEGGRKLFRLLLLGGGVSALVGILTGSYLGFNPKGIPEAFFPLKHFLSSIQIIDPIKTPLTMLILSLALGVTQILFGISLQMAERIKNREYASAILDDGLWIFFLGSLVFLIVSNAAYAPTVRLASWMSIAGAIGLILTQGRHKKNIAQKFLSGLLSLYKVSGYMGDTLSYSRLLALGMSTTIIGSVINILAGMVKGGVPVLGIALMIVLLILGHLFNLVIGTLGAFVHSTRLQMVEFFSKFYEGGGREFRPYRREAEYTILK